MPSPSPEPAQPTSPAGPSAPPERAPARAVKAGWASKLAAAPWVASTYFAEGLPYSIVHQISQEFFTEMGVSLGGVGLTSLYGLPWNFKFLWSPLVDGYGTLRRWILGTEVALALVVMAIAWPAQERDLAFAARAFLVVAFLAATQDIAVDGFYLHALPKDAQAAFSGLRVAAFRVAMLVGKSLLVALAGWASWRACFLTAGALLALLAGGHAVGLPRDRARPAAAAEAPWRLMARAFSSFLAQPGAAVTIAFILLYRAGDAIMFAMSTPMLKRHLGLDLVTRSMVSNAPGTLASVAGAMAGGVLIARLGLKRTLTPIAVLQSLAILIYVALAALKPTLPWIVAAVVAEQLFAGIGTAAFMVFLMRRCEGEYKASHFAVGSALMSVVTTAAGPLSGFVAEQVGFTGLFLFAFAASLPGVMLSRVVPKD